MAWTTPATWTAGQVVSASDMNAQVRDNENYLLSGWALPTMILRNNGGNYTTTSTSFTDVDATNVKISGTLQSGRAMVEGYCSLLADQTLGDGAEIDIIADSTTRAGDATHGLARVPRNGRFQVSVFARFTGLTAGISHDFKLQYRAMSAGTTSIEANPAAGTTVHGTLVLMRLWGM